MKKFGKVLILILIVINLSCLAGGGSKEVLLVLYPKNSYFPPEKYHQTIFEFFEDGKINGNISPTKYTLYLNGSDGKINWLNREFQRINETDDLSMSLGYSWSPFLDAALIVKNGYGNSTKKVPGVKFIENAGTVSLAWKQKVKKFLIRTNTVPAEIKFARTYRENSITPNNMSWKDWCDLAELCKSANCVIIVSASPTDQARYGNIFLNENRINTILSKTGLNRKQVEVINNGVHSYKYPTFQVGILSEGQRKIIHFENQQNSSGHKWYSGENYYNSEYINCPKELISELEQYF
jgi:hypothetical protein